MQKTSLLLLLLCISLCFVDARSKAESKRMIRSHVQMLRTIKFGHLGAKETVGTLASVGNDAKKTNDAANADDPDGEEVEEADAEDDEEMYTQTPNTVW